MVAVREVLFLGFEMLFFERVFIGWRFGFGCGAGAGGGGVGDGGEEDVEGEVEEPWLGEVWELRDAVGWVCDDVCG